MSILKTRERVWLERLRYRMQTVICFSSKVVSDDQQDAVAIGFASYFPAVYQAGFTLIQLMITLTIVGILASMAVPSFSRLVAKNKIANESNQLVAFIRYTRQEANNRGREVVLCSDTAGNQTCNGAGWQHWVAISTVNDTFQPVNTLLRKHSLAKDLTVQTSPANTTSAHFGLLGALILPTTKTDIWICHPKLSTFAKKLTLEASGFMTLTDVTGCGKAI